MNLTHSTDPGPEVVDLTDELALLPAEAESWLDHPARVPTPDLARLIGATDYEWCTWLADELRAAGVSVVEHPGWKTRGRPRTAGPFTPRGVMIHHDASAPGPSPSLARFIAQEGRPAEGIPAPLAQLWVCMGCNGAHPVGTWHVLAAGRANHAGIGDGWGSIGRDLGNTLTHGVEVDHTTGESWAPALRASLVTGSAALMARLGTTPADWLTGHKEYALGRKPDPAGLDMNTFRADVARTISQPAAPTSPAFVKFPGKKHFAVGHQCKHGHVEQLEKWLLELNPKSRREPRDTYTNWTRERVEAFQCKHLVAPGPVDSAVWRAIQRAVRR